MWLQTSIALVWNGQGFVVSYHELLILFHPNCNRWIVGGDFVCITTSKMVKFRGSMTDYMNIRIGFSLIFLASPHQKENLGHLDRTVYCQRRRLRHSCLSFTNSLL